MSPRDPPPAPGGAEPQRLRPCSPRPLSTERAPGSSRRAAGPHARRRGRTAAPSPELDQPRRHGPTHSRVPPDPPAPASLPSSAARRSRDGPGPSRGRAAPVLQAGAGAAMAARGAGGAAGPSLTPTVSRSSARPPAPHACAAPAPVTGAARAGRRSYRGGRSLGWPRPASRREFVTGGP